MFNQQVPYQQPTTLDQVANNMATMPIQGQNYGPEVPVSMGLDVTPPDRKVVMGQYLQNLGIQHQKMKQEQAGRKFLKGVHDIMSSNMTGEDRINKLMDLKVQHGTDYGLGLDSIIKQVADQSQPKEWKPKTQDEALGFERAKAGLKPPTQAQETTALYAGRIKQANDVFRKMNEYISKLPVVGTKLNEWAPNFLKSGDFQAYEQAQRNYLNAVLRRESGAVISPSEFIEGKKQYFPQPGDNKQVLEQKRQNRELVEMNFKASAGNAYAPYEATDPNLLSGGNRQQVPQQQVNLPKTITKTSEAMTYLVNEAGMNPEEAKMYLQQMLSAQ